MSKLKFPEPVESKSAIQTDYPDVEEELTPQKPRDDAGIPENIHFETMFTRPACERIKEYKMRNLRISQMRRQGIPMAAIRAAGNAVQKHAEKKAQDALGLSSAKMTDVEQSIRELWIRKRQEEEQERKSEQEVKEAMLWWAKNRARTEAEISRRQESIRFASQTALLHGRPESEPPTVHASDARGAKQASASAGEASPADDGFVANDEDEEDIEIIEDLMVEKYVLPERFLKTPQLKAPYDGLRTSATTAGWALTSPARPISARLAGRAPGAMHNFGSPRPTSASAAPSAVRALRSHSARARVTTDGAAFAEGAASTISTYPRGGEVPQSRAELEALPGVGRKTANVVLNVAFGEPTMAVDTHIFRIGNRTGIARGANVRAVEDALVRRIPKEMLRDAHHWLILHGRYVCKARRPECWHCVAAAWCRYPGKTAAP